MSEKLKNFNIKISLTLSLLIFNNYFLISLNIFNIILKLNLIIFFLCVFYFYIKNFKNNFILKIIFLLILIVSLGIPVEGWDARSLYLFHAKRIFFDMSIYSVADNYASFSHNDYPLLVPAFSSTFAFLIGYWHEVFPKTAFIFIYLPALIFLSVYLSQKVYTIFLTLVIFFIGNHFYNIGVDGILAVYFVISAFCFFYIFFSKQQNTEGKLFYLNTIFFLASLSMIKNEGIVLLILIFIFTLLIKAYNKEFYNTSKNLLLFSTSFIPILLWKSFCLKNGIVNTDFTLQLLNENLLNRLSIYENYKQFFKFLIFSNEKLIIAIVLFVISSYINFDKKLFYFITLIFASYLLVLLMVYFSTRLDLVYHLSTSANRVLEPLTLFLGFFSIYNLKTKLI